MTFLDGKVTLYAGDCVEVLKSLPEASVDSVVCDPPYELGFMSKRWDATGIANDTAMWAGVLRILKPGGHLLAFSGTRTYHRMVCAIEDAGFEIRDQIGWAYGSGFPKSHDVAKSIDKASRGVPHGGADPTSPNHGKFKSGCSDDNQRGQGFGAGPGQFMAEMGERTDRVLVDEAQPWIGYGTALKPAWEPIVLARKPLIGTVAENVLKHGTGAINVDGCRVETDENLNGGAYASVGGRDVSQSLRQGSGMNVAGKTAGKDFVQPIGRWPANLVHDGSEEVLAAFPDAPGQQGDLNETGRNRPTKTCFGNMGPPRAHKARRDGEASASRRYTEEGATNFAALPGMRRDATSAARFFYTAKADAEDRLGSKHPTVKPLDLMQWLVRLVTPKGGVVLDPFAGTGTTGEAAWREGMRAILIELEPEYQADIARRMELAANPTKRTAVAKTKNKLERPEDLPLFSGAAE